MNYEGPLFGRIGRKYIPLKLTSQDVDRMEADLKSAESILLLALSYLQGEDAGKTSGSVRNGELQEVIRRQLKPNAIRTWKWIKGEGFRDISQCEKMKDAAAMLWGIALALDVQGENVAMAASQTGKTMTMKAWSEWITEKMEKENAD